MTREEYDECVSKLETGTTYEKLQATILLSILPTYDSKIPIEEGMIKIDEAVRGFKYE